MASPDEPVDRAGGVVPTLSKALVRRPKAHIARLPRTATPNPLGGLGGLDAFEIPWGRGDAPFVRLRTAPGPGIGWTLRTIIVLAATGLTLALANGIYRDTVGDAPATIGDGAQVVVEEPGGEPDPVEPPASTEDAGEPAGPTDTEDDEPDGAADGPGADVESGEPSAPSDGIDAPATVLDCIDSLVGPLLDADPEADRTAEIQAAYETCTSWLPEASATD